MLRNNSSKLNKANGIAKIFIDPMGWNVTTPAWTMFSKLKASVGLEKSQLSFSV